MATTIFEATYSASQQITATFDMVWALDAGLWNLRQAATQYLTEHPEANTKEAKDALVKGLYVHGLNLKRIATELSWEYEEQYIAELLLINAIAIFDTWVDEFVDASILGKSNNQRKEIKKAVKAGDFSLLDSALAQEAPSSLAGCFHFAAKKQDTYIDNLRLVYKYFKSCRNCCAHGNRKFSSIAETNYNAIKTFTKDDCGIKEFPKIEVTKENYPLKLILRGVVGFYDILIRIMNHYDIVASDKIAVEAELLRRWSSLPYVALPVELKKRIDTLRYHKKRNESIRFHIGSVNMCRPYVAKTDDIYNFLTANNITV